MSTLATKHPSLVSSHSPVSGINSFDQVLSIVQRGKWIGPELDHSPDLAIVDLEERDGSGFLDAVGDADVANAFSFGADYLINDEFPTPVCRILLIHSCVVGSAPDPFT